MTLALGFPYTELYTIAQFLDLGALYVDYDHGGSII